VIFIAGVHPQITELRVLTMVCWSCRRPAAHRLARARNRFSLFFIPLFTFSTRHILQCLLCGADQELSAAAAGEIADLPAADATRGA